MQIGKLLLMTLGLLFVTGLHAQEATYVIVHGAWGGAWQFKNTAHRLMDEGHNVYRPTLTGLGERFHLADTNITLDTHIKDVVNTILFEDLKEVVLVGHSYGGMVITGVADSIPNRIKKLVYLDAIVPVNGESVITAMGIDSTQVSSRFPIHKGMITPVWVRDTSKTPRDVPHPLHTFTQPIRLASKGHINIPTSYIFTFEEAKGGEEKDDFYRFYKRALGNKWKIYKLEASHNPQIDKLDSLVQILLEEK